MGIVVEGQIVVEGRPCMDCRSCLPWREDSWECAAWGHKADVMKGWVGPQTVALMLCCIHILAVLHSLSTSQVKNSQTAGCLFFTELILPLYWGAELLVAFVGGTAVHELAEEIRSAKQHRFISCIVSNPIVVWPHTSIFTFCIVDLRQHFWSLKVDQE